MIQLHPDALFFKTSSGEIIPCSAEQVTVEFIGDAKSLLDPQLVQHAAHAVLHYFKVEQGKNQVSVGEFAQALATVLRGFGLEVRDSDADDPPAQAPATGLRPVAEADLRQLAFDSGKGFELLFFSRLRHELRSQLRRSPRMIRFKGLRGCVKQLAGARRWNGRCQQLNDQIVGYLRDCLNTENRPDFCSMVVC
ncbi:MAG: hypothetical protein KJ072_01870 [Verrucomicrobia bacterium]|nr:hypothetical protein [Verrucomicrobiota bacterium]